MFSWRPPRAIERMPEQRHQRIRDIYQIGVEGEDIPPPLSRFEVSDEDEALPLTSRSPR
jgi:hypothetical protein